MFQMRFSWKIFEDFPQKYTLSTYTRYTVHGRGAKHWFTPSQIIKSTPNRAPQILQFLNFFHPRNPRQKPFFKVSKKFAKSSSKLFQNRISTSSNPHQKCTLWTLFFKQIQKKSKPKKSIVQNTIAHRHVVTPHILFAKSNYFPYERTNELTFQFWLCART